jgi:phage-related baseplate assembly protein
MADSTVYDLTGFPLPAAIEELDFEVIVSAMKADLSARFPDIAPLLVLESEPAVKLIEVFAYRETLNRARINDAVRANLLAFAGTTDLDNLAVFYDIVRMIGESDERLRLRVVLAIQGRSTGGTVPRYRGVALASSIRVEDAAVYRVGNDPTVHVAVFAADNDGVADAGLLAIVRAALNDPAVRMVNDTIVVASAVFSVENVVANVWLLPETSDTLLEALPASLKMDWEAETGLGFDLTRSWLTARLMKSGVYKVEIVTPATDVVAAPERAVSLGAITLNNMGRGY